MTLLFPMFCAVVADRVYLRFVPSDGATSIVVDGLAKGDRFVVQGASLLNQVR